MTNGLERLKLPENVAQIMKNTLVPFLSFFFFWWILFAFRRSVGYPGAPDITLILIAYPVSVSSINTGNIIKIHGILGIHYGKLQRKNGNIYENTGDTRVIYAASAPLRVAARAGPSPYQTITSFPIR